ncbi:hypothetical protein ACFPFV_05815 [Salinicoccus siamensis]|uniref:hypothetical protein n=1 Tax=Salinicoccus siamensis TaxID=381830 RepID=UPI00361CA2F5
MHKGRAGPPPGLFLHTSTLNGSSDGYYFKITCNSYTLYNNKIELQERLIYGESEKCF